jgi:uncharacterized membrane protein YfcA
MVWIALAAFGASLLTFFSGFGLGTLLLAVTAVFFPLEVAVVLTAIVHMANNLFKIGLVGKWVNKKVLLWFGAAAVPLAVVGALVLGALEDSRPILVYTLSENTFEISWLGIIIGLLLILFALLDELPLWKKLPENNLTLLSGGVLSGFFGGLSGHQGALRSLFLVHAGLTKEAYIATGTAIALLIDAVRIPTYFSEGLLLNASHIPTLIAAVLSALAGAVSGRYVLTKITIKVVQRIVLVLLVVMGLLLIAGIV